MNWRRCILVGWIEDKLALFAKNIDDFADPNVRKKVLEGSESISGETGLEELAVWMRSAMEKLCSLVDDDTAAKIMTYNACRFVEETFLGDTAGELEKLRILYSRNGDIKEIIQLMDQDRSFNGKSMFPVYDLKGTVIHTTKKPCRQAEFDGAKNDYEKQLFYCYCPFVKATRQQIPPVYCNCGAGFNKFIWKAIIGDEVEIRVEESILDGGTCCTFTIHLP